MAQIKTKFITDSAVTNAKLANMATLTIKGNNTGSPAAPLDLSVSDVQTLLSIPTSSAPLALAAGGTGISAGSANAAFNALSPLTTKGDLLSYSSVNARLAVGTNGQVLSADSAEVTGLKWVNAATGTVTSVALSVPAFLSVSGSPITSSGTLAISLSGTALPIANGGTGQVTAAAAFDALNPMTTAGDIIYEVSAGVSARLPIGTSGQVLTVVAGAPAWAADASVVPVAISQNITLNGTDITNQYVDLAHPITGASASVNSANLFVAGGPMQVKGTDYTVSLTGGVAGVTRISFAGDLATAGAAELIAGDILVIGYSF